MAEINNSAWFVNDFCISYFTKLSHLLMGYAEISSHIVYAANRNQISNVWVAGKPLMKDRKLTTIEIDKILNTIQYKHSGKKYRGMGRGEF